MKKTILTLMVSLALSASAFADLVSDFETSHEVSCKELTAEESSWFSSAYYACSNASRPGAYLVFSIQKQNHPEKLKSKFCQNGVNPEYLDRIIGWSYRCAK